MADGAIRILGAYKVELTDDLFQRAMELKYGGIELSKRQRLEAERDVRNELSSIVLIEAVVENPDDRFDAGDFTQPGSDQVAYDEAFLSPDGTSVISRLRAPDTQPLRLTFFLHFFDPKKPLLTSYREVPVPPVQRMPERLKSLVPYEPVT